MNYLYRCAISKSQGCTVVFEMSLSCSLKWDSKIWKEWLVIVSVKQVLQARLFHMGKCLCLHELKSHLKWSSRSSSYIWAGSIYFSLLNIKVWVSLELILVTDYVKASYELAVDRHDVLLFNGCHLWDVGSPKTERMFDYFVVKVCIHFACYVAMDS